jgi:hypothetical protein
MFDLHFQFDSPCRKLLEFGLKAFAFLRLTLQVFFEASDLFPRNR